MRSAAVCSSPNPTGQNTAPAVPPEFTGGRKQKVNGKGGLLWTVRSEKSLDLGRKWSRKTLLNCTLIIKYGLIPFYLVGGSITVYVTLMAFFPLPLMALFGLVTIVFLIFGYGILLGAAPYAIAYLIKSCKDGIHPKWLAVLAGICQFFFSFDVLAMMVLTLKERHRVKTTIAVFCAMCLALLLIVLYVVMTLIGA